jgi:putative transposase
MGAREITNEYRLAHWSQVFGERMEGESVDEFCERNGISRNQFFYWQRKLREMACTELAVQKESGNEVVPSGWTVCKAAETEEKRESLSVEIGNCRISLGDDFDSELLKKVCKALVEIC